MKIRLYYIVPSVVFVAMAIVLFVGLDLNPKETAFPLHDKAPPQIELAPLFEGEPGLATSDMLQGDVVILNFFASWCAPCIAEHPFLMQLGDRADVTVYGINYRDNPPQKPIAWLNRDGNPFKRIGVDPDARAGMEWGLAGVPETFIISREGKVVDRIQGPINEPIMNNDLLPLLEEITR